MRDVGEVDAGPGRHDGRRRRHHLVTDARQRGGAVGVDGVVEDGRLTDGAAVPVVPAPVQDARVQVAVGAHQGHAEQVAVRAERRRPAEHRLQHGGGVSRRSGFPHVHGAYQFALRAQHLRLAPERRDAARPRQRLEVGDRAHLRARAQDSAHGELEARLAGQASDHQAGTHVRRQRLQVLRVREGGHDEGDDVASGGAERRVFGDEARSRRDLARHGAATEEGDRHVARLQFGRPTLRFVCEQRQHAHFDVRLRRGDSRQNVRAVAAAADQQANDVIFVGVAHTCKQCRIIINIARGDGYCTWKSQHSSASRRVILVALYSLDGSTLSIDTHTHTRANTFFC